MLKQLFIHLDPSDATQASWAVIDDTDKVVQSAHGTLAELKLDTSECDITVIIPAQDVVLLSAKLPKLNRHRLEQALPYALEDQLIDDIDDLHFAVGEYQADGTYPVAVVKQEKMEHWLAQLKQFNLQPSILIPEVLAIPYAASHWHILIEDHTAVLRSGQFDGFACDTDNLATMLGLKISESQQKPLQIECHNYTQTSVTLNIDHTQVIDKISPSSQLIYDFVNWNSGLPSINLLQGDYPPKQKTSQIKKVWVATSLLAAAIIAFAIASNLISFFILEYHVARLSHQINTIYHRNFPQATSTAAPKERMVEKLHKLDQQAGHNRFLLWLGYVAKGMEQVQGIRVTRLDFSLDQMSLEISAPSFDVLDNFTQMISQQGLVVKQQNAVAAGTQVKTNLLISETGA